MSLTTRALTARKSAIRGSAALALGLFGSSGAWAQCTDNFNYRAVNVPGPGQFAPVSVLAPLGTGSSLSAFISTINYGQHGLPDEYERLCQRAGRPAARSAGRRCVGACHWWNCRHENDQLRHPRSVRARRAASRDGDADLPYDYPAGLRRLPGRPRHFDTERRGHRGQLALGRDRRLLRGQDQGQDAGRNLHPTPTSLVSPSPRRPGPSAQKRKCRSRESTPPSPRGTSSSTVKSAWTSIRTVCRIATTVSLASSSTRAASR